MPVAVHEFCRGHSELPLVAKLPGHANNLRRSCRSRTTETGRSEMLARRARATGRVGIAANQTALDGEPHQLAHQRGTAGAASRAQLSATVPDRRPVEGLLRSSWRGLAVPVRRTPAL